MLLLLAWIWWRARRINVAGNPRPPVNNPPPKPGIYLQLRDVVLQGSRQQFGLPPAASRTEPFAVVMDWGISAGTATVVAIADGNASVYLSNEGGSIGGGQSQESIRSIAKRMVSLAPEVQPLMQFAKTFPLPPRGEVNFYVLTDAGIFTASASENDLSNDRSPFFKLGDSAQAIISKYRMIQG